MTNVRAVMLKINPGIVFGGGVGVERKGAGTRNIVWPVFPLPCLPPSPPTSLLLPSSPQRILGCPAPIPDRVPKNSTPGLVPGEDMAL